MSIMFPKEELIATMKCEADALLPCKLDWPVQRLCYWGGQPGDSRPAGQTAWCDTWGVGWRKESPNPELLPMPVEHPLDTHSEGLDRYAWPDARDPQLFADLVNRRHASNHLLIGEHPFALYERAWLLAGMQHLLEAMAESPGWVNDLFARIGEFEASVAEQYIRMGVEAAWISDDYGMKSGLMFSPAMWREFVRPHLQRVIDLYRNAGALVILHSCGNIEELVSDFLELGVHVLDPLQPTCNRLDMIRAQTMGRICLCGGIESSVLLGGDTARTLASTSERIEQLGKAGGYIVGPDDEWRFPESTHTAMLSAVERRREQIRRNRSRDVV
jgi:uroporphyrinogen decarboxylase